MLTRWPERTPSVGFDLPVKVFFHCILLAMVVGQLTPRTVAGEERRHLARVRSDDGASEASFRRSKSVAAEEGTTSRGFSAREMVLLQRIDQLERRVAALESRLAVGASATPPLDLPAKSQEERAPAQNLAERADSAGGSSTPALPGGVKMGILLDGYYGYNLNRPVGRINLLRAYDVLSNSFSLSQAAVVIEKPPDVAAGRRIGLRLDLQYGQATETLQGNAANELRPQAYRPIFQAYGTYVAPVGRGLTVDFGKWAGALSVEGNYSKDQMNYSRSYFYTYSPFYHFGFRTSYEVNDRLRIEHWLVNGAQQSEDFNGFKSQAILVTVKPRRTLSWNVNYYTGVEGRDSVPVLNPGFASLPTQPGLSTDVIRPAPRGRLHIADSYVLWNPTGRLTLAGQGFYVVNREQTFSPPSRVTGGGAWARYQFTPRFSLAGRAEYLSDRGGLFSGVPQALKETTATADYKLADGFLIRTEWRRDSSNQPFFLTNSPGVLRHHQNTATLGLVWWFGNKQGTW